MKYVVILIPVITLVVGVTISEMTSKKEKKKNKSGLMKSPVDTSDFDQEKALTTLREQIKGRENESAKQVFENIKTFERLPAGRLLRIMETGFSRSLGVKCTHCHNPSDWASEEKNQKQIAREMMAMVGKINGELLTAIDNLESDSPTINCTTCHRGQVKPALNLDNK